MELFLTTSSVIAKSSNVINNLRNSGFGARTLIDTLSNDSMVNNLTETLILLDEEVTNYSNLIFLLKPHINVLLNLRLIIYIQKGLFKLGLSIIL